MLRIQCACGKALKVNETLLGKRIKCPGCGSVHLVAPAAPVLSEVQPTVQPVARDAVVSGPTPKKAPTSSAPAPVPVPKRRPPRDYDEEAEDRPRRRKPVQKQGSMLPWILLGGGAGLFVLVMGAGALFLLLRGEDKSKSNETAAGGANVEAPGGNRPQTYPVKLFVPHKRGDQREVTVVQVHKQKGEPITKANFRPDELAGLAVFDVDLSVKIKAVVKTLELSPLGEEIKVELTLDHVECKAVGKEQLLANLPPVPKGAIAIGTRRGVNSSWISPDGRVADAHLSLMGTVVDERFFGISEMEADRLLGTRDRQAVGGSWPIGANDAAKAIRTQGVLTKVLEGLELADPSGTGNLVNVASAAGKSWLDTDIAMNFSILLSTGGNVGTFQATTSMRLPADGTTGPVRKTDKFTYDMVAPFNPLKGIPDARKTVKLTMDSTITTEVKYLSNVPLTDPPVDKGSGKSKEIAKGLRAEDLKLNNVKVEWLPQLVDGAPAVKVSADYVLGSGMKFNPDATYTLVMEYAGENNAVHTPGKKFTGSDLPASGLWLDQIIVKGFAKGTPPVCNVAFYENLGAIGKNTVLLASQRDVAITGLLPGTTTPIEGGIAVDLANAKVEFLPNKKLRFSVDYKFKGAKPDPGKTYQLLAKVDGITSKSPLMLIALNGETLPMEGPITPPEVASAAAAGAKVEMWLAVDAGKGVEGTRVSNIAVANTGTPGGKLGSGVEFALENEKGVFLLVQGNGKQVRYLQLQLTWKKTGGEVKPKALYALCVLVNGERTAILTPEIPGNSFPTAFQFNRSDIEANVIPATFEVALMELAPGQKTWQVVSNKITVNVK